MCVGVSACVYTRLGGLFDRSTSVIYNVCLAEQCVFSGLPAVLKASRFWLAVCVCVCVCVSVLSVVC